jgi:ATP-dependent Lon protease
MAPKKITDFALLPLRNLVVFPNQVVPLFVGRAKSIQAIEYAVAQKQRLPVLLVRRSEQRLL